ncbi:hypothetical protein [Catenuloplanes atrovinosus]|uniref:Uncharacterized protein n=1 Tax=Catenuloplanes atrovinosus TaxID=137266 RepID=A0AAE4C8Y2_9ACTN|nr:hypothetical protein [Catenuloplanes atrovinosus]MDR7275473.1 hypothetical protein [Catenuloplanes atrovinosus]
MLTEHIRDAAMTAVIFGFFSTAWFGWAQERPPAGWRRYLLGGTALGVVTLAGGLAVALPNWSGGTAFDADTGRAFGIVVGIECTAAGLGAGVLAGLRRAPWIPVWIAFVVGVHFFPLAVLLGYPLLHVTAVLVTLVSVVAVPVARARGLTPSAAVGAGTGASLLACALVSLAAALTAY